MQLPLTEKALNMKDIGDALDNASVPDYFSSMKPAPAPCTVPDTPLAVASNVSERGSRISTPSELSDTTLEEAHAIGRSATSDSSSDGSSDIVFVNGASDSPPEVSLDSASCSSSLGSGALAHKHRVRKSLSDSYWVLGPS